MVAVVANGFSIVLISARESDIKILLFCGFLKFKNSKNKANIIQM